MESLISLIRSSPFFLFYPSLCTLLFVKKEKIFICSVGKILGIFFLSLCPMQQRWRNNGRRCIFHSISTARRRQSLPEITLTLDLKPRRDDNPLTRSVRTVCDQLYRVDRCTLVSVYAQWPHESNTGGKIASFKPKLSAVDHSNRYFPTWVKSVEFEISIIKKRN